MDLCYDRSAGISFKFIVILDPCCSDWAAIVCGAELFGLLDALQEQRGRPAAGLFARRGHFDARRRLVHDRGDRSGDLAIDALDRRGRVRGRVERDVADASPPRRRR